MHIYKQLFGRGTRRLHAKKKAIKITALIISYQKKASKLHSYVKIENAYQQKSIDKWIFHAVKKMGRYTHDP